MTMSPLLRTQPERPSPDRKRFQTLFSPHLPYILLNGEGSIVHLTPAARRLLEYSPGRPVDALFLALVHGKNLRQVVRDIEAMGRGAKKSAFWLCRLRTGKSRWYWFRITVENRLQQSERVIVLRLRDLRD